MVQLNLSVEGPKTPQNEFGKNVLAGIQFQEIWGHGLAVGPSIWMAWDT